MRCRVVGGGAAVGVDSHPGYRAAAHPGFRLARASPGSGPIGRPGAATATAVPGSSLGRRSVVAALVGGSQSLAVSVLSTLLILGQIQGQDAGQDQQVVLAGATSTA